VTSPKDPVTLEQLAVLETPDSVARTGISDARLLAIILRDGDHNITAGLHGWTWGEMLRGEDPPGA